MRREAPRGRETVLLYPYRLPRKPMIMERPQAFYKGAALLFAGA